MKKETIKQAIFFDLDGTLWDALLPIKDSWNLAMAKNNLKYSFDMEKIKSYMGLTPLETAKIAFPDVSIDKAMTYFKLAIIEEINYLALHPGKLYSNEKIVLERLSKKYPLFIVSNCDKGYIENYLNALNMNKYFIDHTCIGDTGLEKWQNILFLKEKHSIDEIIYVGDTNKDYQESSKANVKFIHAKYGFGVINDKVASITNLDELDKKIEELLRTN